MPRPQHVILPEPARHARFLIVRVDGPGVSRATRTALSFSDTAANVATLDVDAGLVAGVALGSAFWDVVSPSRRPAGLRPFVALESAGRSAPSTGGDLLFHITSDRADLNAELLIRTMRDLDSSARVMEDVQGFRYLDARDLTGFIDGTENPEGEERADAALIGDEDEAFAGGSYVFTQRYVHDLTKWNGVPVPEQEKTIGRRKADSEELADDVKPPTAHISRVVIEENGQELEILRHSFPYATATEAGLFFIAYTRDLEIPEKMLARMMGVSGDGVHDHLLDFTAPVSGATFFAPSLDVLAALA